MVKAWKSSGLDPTAAAVTLDCHVLREQGWWEHYQSVPFTTSFLQCLFTYGKRRDKVLGQELSAVVVLVLDMRLLIAHDRLISRYKGTEAVDGRRARMLSWVGCQPRIGGLDPAAGRVRAGSA